MPQTPEICPVAFQRILSADVVEEALQGKLKETLKAPLTILDLKETVFAETFAISLLLVWISRIKGRAGHKVEIVPPGYRGDGNKVTSDFHAIRSTFTSRNVWAAFQHVGAEIRGFDSSEAPPEPPPDSLPELSYLPLTFYRRFEDWNAFLAALAEPTNISRLFPDDSANLQIVGSGGLRAIILGEVGKNAFEHGKGAAAHVVIRRIGHLRGISGAHIDEKINARIRAVPRYAQSFYASLGNADCIEVIISDAGPGIPETLKNAYNKDQIITNKLHHPDDATLIEYAFLLHSTSKPDSWYNVTGDNKQQYKTPRGLFFVKNIARRNRALLVCRSGSAYHSWDFSSSPNGLQFRERHLSKRGKKLRLAALGGTQIRILIPVKDWGSTSAIVDTGKMAITDQALHKIKVVPVAEIVAEGPKENGDQVSRHLVRAIHRVCHSTPPDHLIVVDFLGTRWASEVKATLFPLVAEVGYLSLDNRVIAVIHTAHIDSVLKEMLLDRREDEVSGAKFPRTRPFLKLLPRQQTVDFELMYPADNVAGNVLKEMLSGKQPDAIPEVLDHLLKLAEDGTIRLSFDPKRVQSALVERRNALLGQVVLNPSFGVCHQGKFLLPSGYYSDQFYQIASLFDAEDTRELLRETLLAAYDQFAAPKSTVVCLSTVGCEVGRLLAERRSGSSDLSIRYFPSIDKMIGFPETPNRDCPVVVLVDVIATGSSLGAAVGILSNGFDQNKIRAIAVLDIRSGGVPSDEFIYKNIRIPLRSLLRKPGTLHLEKPHSWLFADVVRIDSTFWRPIVEQAKPKDLWSGTNFVEVACLKSDAIRIGHYFAPNGNHYRFFFLTKNIIATYRDYIIEQIENRLRGILEAARMPPVSYVLFPGDSFGVPEIAERLSSLHGGARLIPVERGKDVRTYSIAPADGSAVVILDSASSSNRTVCLLLDVAAQARPLVIIGCIMMSRAPEENLRFITEVKSYSGSDVEIFPLTRISLPVFESEGRCPLCRRIGILEDLVQSNRYTRLNAELRRQLTALRPKSIEMFGCAIDTQPRTTATHQNASIAFRRMLITQASLGEMARLLGGDPAGELKDHEALILALQFEAHELLHTKAFALPDHRKKLQSIAETVALRTGDDTARQAAIEVRWATEPETFGRFVEEYVETNLTNSANIALLLAEMLVQAEVDREYGKDLASMVEQAVGLLEGSAQREFVSVDVIPLLANFRRGLNYESRLREAAEGGFRKNFEVLSGVLSRRYAGTHRYIKRAYMFINMISDVASARSVLADYYFAQSGFAAVVFDQLLPAMSALEGAFELVNDELESKYLLSRFTPSLRRDLYHLDSVLTAINERLAAGLEDDTVVQSMYDEAEFRAVRSRLLDWLAKEDTSNLETVAEGLICSIDKVIRGCCDHWRATFKKAGIGFVESMPAKPMNCFSPKKGVLSIADDLLDNCWRHAFRGKRPSHPSVNIALRAEQGFAVLEVRDNGCGLGPQIDGGRARITAVLEPLDGRAELVPTAEGTMMRVSWLLKDP